jgi:signal transduction histidine kinase
VDERFKHLAPLFDRYEIKSMVSVPLGPSDHPIGALNAYFAAAEALDEEDFHLLNAYGRQAYIAVARAIAFEKEKHAAAKLAEADRLKSDFVSTVSHELRTPLTSVCGFVETVLLQWERLNDDAKKDLLQRAAWNASELRRLIEQILALSRAESVGLASDAAPYRLRAGVEALVQNMAPVLSDRRVHVEIPDDMLVLANAESIHHIVGNLLSNASKFSADGSRIRVSARQAMQTAWITVADEGAGINAEDQQRIFERFYRGATTSSTRGTGIGLAIVRTSVERLGGSISVSSQPGAGSTFEFTLPLAQERARALTA